MLKMIQSLPGWAQELLWVAVAVATFVMLLSSEVWCARGIVYFSILMALRFLTTNWRVWRAGLHQPVARQERFLMLLVSLMGLFLATGTALYIEALYQDHKYSDDPALYIAAEYLFRSLSCSFNLFTFGIDSDVIDKNTDAWLLKGLISLQAVLSFSCTVIVLISLVFARIRARYKLHHGTVVDEAHNHLYVFFGMDESALLLARSIRSTEGERAQIVFVESNQVDEDDLGGWNSIVGMFTHRWQTFKETDDLNARVTFTEVCLSGIDTEELGDDSDVLGMINLGMLRKLISQLPAIENSQLHLLFLSESVEDNMHGMATLLRDKTIKAVNDSMVFERGQKLCIYCHARRNSLNRVIEDIAVKRGIEVSIVDSAHLAIELLKDDVTLHPVSLVDIDRQHNPSTVTSPFYSLVVGFSQVGRDALRFLYEFGAFVDSSSTPEHSRRSPFHCVAVDRDMDCLSSSFTVFAPSVMAQRNADGSPLVELLSADCNHTDFLPKVVGPMCQQLNYVVIAIGDDELGMKLAVRIFSYVRMHRQDLSRLRILVCSYDPNKEKFLWQIAKHYNEGYNNDCDRCGKPGLKTKEVIIPFGQRDRIYSYRMIIDDDLVVKGQEFQHGYATMKGETEFWADRHKILTGAAEYRKDENGKWIKDENGKKVVFTVPTDQRKTSLDNLRSLRRKERQDIANAQHASTKLCLLRKTLGDNYDWQSFLDHYFTPDRKPDCVGSLDRITYPCLSDRENSVVLNLAQLEHLRWNASHELLGYIPPLSETLHSCDERTCEHNCLVAWEELDRKSRDTTSAEGWKADYKAYDFGVVDNSILLYAKELLPIDNKQPATTT